MACIQYCMVQDKEKARLEENRAKVIDRTKAIIVQAERMRNVPVGSGEPYST